MGRPKGSKNKAKTSTSSEEENEVASPVTVKGKPAVGTTKIQRISALIQDRTPEGQAKRDRCVSERIESTFSSTYFVKPTVEDLEYIISLNSGKGGNEDEYGIAAVRAAKLKTLFASHGAVTAAIAKRLLRNPSACFLITTSCQEGAYSTCFYVYHAELRGLDTLVKTSSKDERQARTNFKFNRTGDSAETENEDLDESED